MLNLTFTTLSEALVVCYAANNMIVTIVIDEYEVYHAAFCTLENVKNSFTFIVRELIFGLGIADV